MSIRSGQQRKDKVMLESFAIALRECFEAFLVVAIILAYLRKAGKTALVPAVYGGVALAVVLSVAGGWLLFDLSGSDLFEGLVSAVAGVMVFSLTLHVYRNAKNFKGEIESRLLAQAEKPGFIAVFGIFALTVALVAREGIETAMMFGAISDDVAFAALAGGGVLGIATALGLGALWLRSSRAFNLRRFMQATAFYLFLFSAYLLFSGFHELTEASAFPVIDNGYWHMVTEPLAEDGLWSRLLLAGMISLPCGWLLWARRQDAQLAKTQY